MRATAVLPMIALFRAYLARQEAARRSCALVMPSMCAVIVIPVFCASRHKFALRRSGRNRHGVNPMRNERKFSPPDKQHATYRGGPRKALNRPQGGVDAAFRILCGFTATRIGAVIEEV